MSLTLEIDKPEAALSLIRAKGEIDHHTFETLDDELHRLIDDGVLRILLDLGGVTYVSSAGIGALVGAMSEVENGGGALVLYGIQKDVLAVFQTMGFTELFKIAPSHAAALDLARAG
ncbi:MAG: STAS domain-containing protein [Planctomycetota bacterium]|nr:STAS domain-containing protein [Planctomycetota bacterium]